MDDKTRAETVNDLKTLKTHIIALDRKLANKDGEIAALRGNETTLKVRIDALTRERADKDGKIRALRAKVERQANVDGDGGYLEEKSLWML